MENINETIENLSGQRLLEAAQFVAYVISEGNEEDGIENELKSILQDPFANIDEIESFCRILLRDAASSEKYLPLVSEAIENTGKKNLIIGGTEIIILCSLALAALKILGNPPTYRKIEYKKGEEKYVEETRYQSESPILGKLMAMLAKKIGMGDDNQ